MKREISFLFSNPDDLLKRMVKRIQRRDHLEEIQTILQTHLANLPDATSSEMQAHVWMQWARQKKHLKVNTAICIVFLDLCQTGFLHLFFRDKFACALCRTLAFSFTAFVEIN